MLRVGKDGSISLTIKNEIIATLDCVAVSELSPIALAQWENTVRRRHYETRNGFWSEKNQQEARAAEVSEERLRQYPLAKIQTTEAHNTYWDFHRTMAIDN
jgi:hypothetical protein